MGESMSESRFRNPRLWSAVSIKDTEKVRALLSEEDIDTEERGYASMADGSRHLKPTTPLERAIKIISEKNDITIIQLLLKRGADMELYDTSEIDYSLIHEVLMRNLKVGLKSAVCSMLLLSGIKVNNGEGSGNVLHTALEFVDDEEERLDLFALLIMYHFNIENENIWGETPLHLATQMCLFDEIRVLFEHQANVNATCTYFQHTPLHMIIASTEIALPAKWDYVYRLIEYGADIYIRDFFGDTAMDIARRRDEDEFAAIIEFAYHSRQLEFTPLHLAAEMCLFDAMQVLLKDQANVNVTCTSLQHTPLHMIMASNSIPLIERWNHVCLLIRYGADIESKNFFGDTVMDIARRRGADRFASDIENEYYSRRFVFASALYTDSQQRSIVDVISEELGRIILDKSNDKKTRYNYALKRI